VAAEGAMHAGTATIAPAGGSEAACVSQVIRHTDQYWNANTSSA